MHTSEALQRADELIASIPEYPKPGIVFQDLTPLFVDGEAFTAVVDALAAPYLGSFDAVAGLEARGFLLAGAIARATGTGVVPLRKAGKLPRKVERVAYALEYGEAVIEAHTDDLPPGSRVLIVDDVLATGGTLGAAVELASQLSWHIAGLGVVLELDELRGRARIDGLPLTTLFHR